MSYCDMDEGPEIYRIAEPVARKEHICCECLNSINPGEKYVYIFGIWDGDAQVYKQHVVCAEACEAVRDADVADGCLNMGGLREWLGEDQFLISSRASKKDPKIAKVRKAIAAFVRRERAG